MSLSPALREHLKRCPGEVGFAAAHLDKGLSLIYRNRVFVAASTIKLPVLAYYALQRDNLNWPEYRYLPADYIADSPYFDTLQPGQAVSWDTLAEWMMIRSDNTATNLLIQQLGLPALSRWLQTHGFIQTRLQRLMMDLEARAAGRENLTSPAEMLDLMSRLLQGQLLPPEATAWLLNILYRCEDREKIPFFFQPPILVANKPGELPGLRADVGYIQSTTDRVMMALFVDQLPSTETEIACDLWLAELAQLLWKLLTESPSADALAHSAPDALHWQGDP